MSLSNVAGAAPIFFGPHWPNSASDTAGQITAYNNSTGTFVTPSMQALVHRICQMDPTAYWIGSGGADDTKTERITMGLYQGSILTAVSLDSFLILNCNLKGFTIEYCADYVPGAGGAEGTGTWVAVTGGTVAANTSTDFALFLAAAVSANGLRLTMTTTITANQQKQVGNFIAALSKFQLSSPPTRFKAVPRQKRVDNELADGTIDSTYFNWSDNSFTLYMLDFEFDFLTSTDKSNLDDIFLSPAPFLVYPEPGDTPRAVYLGLFDLASYVPDYSSQWKGAGRRIPMRVKQVGYA